MSWKFVLNLEDTNIGLERAIDIANQLGYSYILYRENVLFLRGKSRAECCSFKKEELY